MSKARLQRTRHGVLLAALCGLLLAQGLALWHGLAHRHGPQPTVGVHSEAAPADHWGHAEGEAGCRLVDQLLTGLAGVPTPLLLALAVPAQAPRACTAPAHARGSAASFLARAPPRG
jgi:hypothetical protein